MRVRVNVLCVHHPRRWAAQEGRAAARGLSAFLVDACR